MNIIFADLEGDALLGKLTKIHVASFKAQGSDKIHSVTDYVEIASYFENPDNLLVMHNGISYDARAVEKVIGCRVSATIIDTLFLSWYLYPKMHSHGLKTWGEILGREKETITDWHNLSVEEYTARCEGDVEIQELLWQKMWKDLNNLYDSEEQVWHCINHITFKAKVAAMQEVSGWRLDVDACERLYADLTVKYELATGAMAAEMPKVKKYKTSRMPKQQLKANGDPTALWLKWVIKCNILGEDPCELAEITEVAKLLEPNAGSVSQVKSWLFSLGWNPETYKYVKDEDKGTTRKVDQIKDPQTGKLCPSVERLIDDNPCLEGLRHSSVVKHRMGVCKGLLENVGDDGFVVAGVQGFTNTLRFKHRICVNLPSVRKPYGKEIRGLLLASSDSNELCGSDMCSLEDRTKQHFMWAHDPDYVREMRSDNFDPHLDMCVEAGMITLEDVEWYQSGADNDPKLREYISDARQVGKVVNYSATYGAGPTAIARQGRISHRKAEALHKAYWDRNWSLRKIADDCVTKKMSSGMWLWNPVSEMWLSLRSEKDRFSTLNQSTGTYVFDRWIHFILKKRAQITGQFHDEVVMDLKKGNRDAMTRILKESIAQVNKELNLNCAVDCDVNFSNNYAGIH